MRARISLALFVSVVLIGAAFWSRNTPAQNGALVAVESNDALEQEVLHDFLEPDVVGLSGSTTNTSPTNTSLAGQQLLMGYLDLVNKGQDTPESLSYLADRYVETLPDVLSSTQISIRDINTVGDSKINFQTYANAVEKIRKDYAAVVNSAYKEQGSISTLDSGFIDFATKSAAAYEAAAIQLKEISVPKSLSSAHVELVNVYYSSAAAMKALASTDEDSVTAFAGLVKVTDNTDKENSIIRQMDAVLTKNGL